MKIKRVKEYTRKPWVADGWVYLPERAPKRKRKAFRTKSDAQAWCVWLKQREAEAHAQHRAGLRFVDPLAEQVAPTRTFNEWSAVWLESCRGRRLTAATIRAYGSHLENHLRPRFGDRLLADIDATGLEIMVADLLDAGRAVSTVRHVVKVMRACLGRAVRDGLIPFNPVDRMQLPKQRPTKDAWTWLTEAELRRVVDAADGEWGAVILFYARTGARLGEGIALGWNDVDLEHRRLTFRRACAWVEGHEVLKDTKGSNVRLVGIRQDVHDWLRKHPSRFKGQYVLTGPNGRRINRWNLKNAFDRAVSRAEIGRHVRFHDLRHTAASHWVQRGLSLREVQMLLGHASIVTTERYGHLSPETTADAVRALDSE